MRPATLTDEQIVALLREAERDENSIAQLARENDVAEQGNTVTKNKSKPRKQW